MEDATQGMLDTARIMVLLQRRYGSVREIERLTGELAQAFERNDEISANMLLEMRAEEMEKADSCMEEIWQMGETDREAYERLHSLVASDLSEFVANDVEENKIYEIRQRTCAILQELRAADQRLNKRIAGKKSYYGAETEKQETPQRA